MFLIVSILVFLGPDTFRYSQERITKKYAPVHSWDIARLTTVVVDLWSCRITESEKTFYGFVLESESRYPPS